MSIALNGRFDNATIVLPVKILPHLYESCFGYLIRLATENGYPSPRWIANNWRLRNPHQGVTFLSELCQITGLQLHELLKLDYSLFYRRISYVHYSKRARICPACVKENGYYDYMWEIAFASACPYHRVQLIDSCPDCSSRLTWDLPQIEYCKCGFDLRDAQTNKADKILLYFNTMLWAADGRNVPIVHLPGVPEGILSEFNLNAICHIFRFLFRSASNKPVKANSKPKYVSDAIEAIKIVHPILDSWPYGLYRFLDSFRNENGDFRGEGLNQAFGGFYRGLYEIEVFKFLKEVFLSYTQVHWAGKTDMRYREISAPNRCGYTLIKSAAKRLGTCRSRINKLLDLGVISGIRKQRPSGRNYTVLKKCEVRRFGRIIKYIINKDETRDLMGISEKQFDVLVEHKLIVPLIKEGDKHFSEWWFDRRKIDHFLNKILVMVPKYSPEAGTICFTKVCQAYLSDVQIVPYLLQKIIRGEFEVAGMNVDVSEGKFKLSALYFNKENIAVFRKNIVNGFKHAYSIPEVAHMMGLKQEALYHLVNSGLFKCHYDPLKPKYGRMISSKEIAEFEEHYISLGQLSRIRGECNRVIKRSFERLNIEPVAGGRTDKCVTVIYRRSDLPRSYRAKAPA